MLEIQEEMKEYQKKKQQNELGLMKKRQVARMRDTIRNCGTKGRYQVKLSFSSPGACYLTSRELKFFFSWTAGEVGSASAPSGTLCFAQHTPNFRFDWAAISSFSFFKPLKK